ARQTQRFRSAQLAIRAALIRDLLRLWRVVDPEDLRGTIHPFVGAATVLVRVRRRDAAGLAAAYYRQLRRVEAGTDEGVPLPRVEAGPDEEHVAGLLRGAALAGIINARRAGQSLQAATQNGFVKVSGTATRLTLDGAREAVLELSSADRRSPGWRRVTDGSPCEFCAERSGMVLRSPDFSSHDHCGCVAEPQF